MSDDVQAAPAQSGEASAIVSDVMATIANPSASNILADIGLVINLFQDIKAKLGGAHPSVVAIFKLLLSEL